MDSSIYTILLIGEQCFFFFFFFWVLKFYSIDESFKFVLAIFVSQKNNNNNCFSFSILGFLDKVACYLWSATPHILRLQITRLKSIPSVR